MPVIQIQRGAEDRSVVQATISCDDEDIQVLLAPGQARDMAFALMDIADDIEPPEWKQ